LRLIRARASGLGQNRGMGKQWILGTAAVAIAAAGAFFVVGGSQAAPQTTFVLLDGSKETTAGLKGKVALVNFWATSCVTCVAEMPKMVSTYDKYHAKGYEHIGGGHELRPAQLCRELRARRASCRSRWPSTTPARWPRPGARCS
jgi:hypothetical protein